MNTLGWQHLACFSSAPIDILLTAQHTGESRPNTDDAQSEQAKEQAISWGTDLVTILLFWDHKTQEKEQAFNSVFQRQTVMLTHSRISLKNFKEPKHEFALNGP